MRAVNPFFTTQQGPAIGDNIASALFGDPQRAGAHALRTAKTNLANQELGGKESLAGLFEAFQPGSDVSPSFAANAVRGGVRGSDLASLILALNANNQGVDDAAVVRSIAGTGRTLGANDAVSLGGQSRIRADNERIGDERNNADNAAAQARLEFDLRNRPVTTGAGATTTLAPGDTRGETIVGLPTLSTERGGILQDARTGEPVSDLARELFQSSGKGARPIEVGPKDIGNLDNEIARSLGALDAEGNILPGFDEAIGADRLAEARRAGAAAFQQTNNFQAAVDAAVKALNLQEGQRFEPENQGFLGTGLFGSDAQILPPDNGNPAGDIPPAPPLNSRQVGQVYSTPKGPFRWTAEGWEPAS